jgi:hypothetical protein
MRLPAGMNFALLISFPDPIILCRLRRGITRMEKWDFGSLFPPAAKELVYHLTVEKSQLNANMHFGLFFDPVSRQAAAVPRPLHAFHQD